MKPKNRFTGVNAMNHGSAGNLRSFWLGSILCGLCGAAQAATAAQPTAAIALDPAIECWSDSEFPLLGAVVTPPEDIVRSRLYFRCSLYPDYYFVDLADESGAYRGVAPQAEDACPQVHYYVEALGRDFTSVRTEERVAEVASPDECRRRFPFTAWFPGEDPNIFLGSTLGTTGMASGFKTVGIAGFISSIGSTVALGGGTGGLSTGVVAGVAAGGAAAAGLGVLATGGNSTTTTAPLVVPPPPPPPSSSVLVACFTIDPPSGSIQVNESLRIDGRCSQGGDSLTYHYDLGDGRTKDGQAFVTSIWPSAGIYTLTLTVSRNSPSARASQALETDSVSREIRVEEPPAPPAPVTADFTARNVRTKVCIGEFDGSPSTGDIVRYSWELDLNGDFGSVVMVEGQVVTYDWGSACFRNGGLVTARLTVFGPTGNQDSVTKTVNILTFGPIPARQSLVESSFASEISQAKAVEGQVVIEGGRGFPVSADAPTRIQFAGRRGRVSIEAVATAASAPFLWRFDFSGAKGFVPGSLRTVSGQEVSRDAYSVVLRFSGGAFERARLEYRLEP
jgi:PKD repeat protein